MLSDAYTHTRAHAHIEIIKINYFETNYLMDATEYNENILTRHGIEHASTRNFQRIDKKAEEKKILCLF